MIHLGLLDFLAAASADTGRRVKRVVYRYPPRMFAAPLAGRYAVQSELASGGSGRIYLAEDLRLGRPVAVKVVAPSAHLSLEEGVRRLEREARVAGAINHPNVCAVSDVGKLDDGLTFLVMELLTGETLANCLWREKVLPLRVALDFAQQMLAGLDAAHRRGIIHRDIKPDNMFLTRLGPGRRLLKLLDFGTAQVPGIDSPHGDDLTRTGVVIGTMPYMSPEQLRGIRDFDARTDVYSCAVVIYEILTGKRPFGDLPDDRVGEAIAFSRPPSILQRQPTLPPRIARAIDEALSLNRMRRPADAGAFLEALRSGRSPLSARTDVLPNRGFAPPPANSNNRMRDHQAFAPNVVDVGDEEDWDVPTRLNAADGSPLGAPDWDVPTRQNMAPPDESDEWAVKTTESRPQPYEPHEPIETGSVDVDDRAAHAPIPDEDAETLGWAPRRGPNVRR